RHRGISYLLVPMRQDGVEIRPIHQLTRDGEFNEVFFSGARTAAANVVGEPEGGWAVAMGTLAFERGASTLGQNLMFWTEWEAIVDAARAAGRLDDPTVRQRLVETWTRLRLMRLNALRFLSSALEAPPAAAITKLFWSTLHRDLGELAMDVLGPHATLAAAGAGGWEPTRLQRLFLFSRADTIYAGTSEIQRNLIGERAPGLPKEPQCPHPRPRRAEACSRGRWCSSPPRRAPGSATPPPVAASRRAPPSCSPTPTSAASAKPPTSWSRSPAAPGPPPPCATCPSRPRRRRWSTAPGPPAAGPTGAATTPAWAARPRSGR